MGIFDWLFKKGNEDIEKYIKRKKRSTRWNLKDPKIYGFIDLKDRDPKYIDTIKEYRKEIKIKRYNLCKKSGYNENKCVEFSNPIIRIQCPKCYFAGYSEHQSNGFISTRKWSCTPGLLVGSGGSEMFCTKHNITISRTEHWIS
tara:strand:- start:848 stop:1279 length:432 start_codon:yes stop_codon:yes gene_type:complete